MTTINLSQQNCIVIRLDLFDIGYDFYFGLLGVSDVTEIKVDDYKEALEKIESLRGAFMNTKTSENEDISSCVWINNDGEYLTVIDGGGFSAAKTIGKTFDINNAFVGVPPYIARYKLGYTPVKVSVSKRIVTILKCGIDRAWKDNEK